MKFAYYPLVNGTLKFAYYFLANGTLKYDHIKRVKTLTSDSSINLLLLYF